MTRHTVLLPAGLWEQADEKSTLFSVSEAIRVLLKSYQAGLVDIYELSKQLDNLEKQEQQESDQK